VVEIDADVFTYQEELGYSNENFLVSGARDVQSVVTGLEAAGRRFLLVDQTGVEHPDRESAVAAVEAGLFTPNYVADPQVTEVGVEMYVDCKGVIAPPMADKLRQVLREELEAAGIEGRVRAL
jgi:hypothetical protein